VSGEKPPPIPEKRKPACACDSGYGKPPPKLQMLECKMKGGPCRYAGENVSKGS